MENLDRLVNIPGYASPVEFRASEDGVALTDEEILALIHEQDPAVAQDSKLVWTKRTAADGHQYYEASITPKAQTKG